MHVTAGWRVHADSKLLQERGARCQEPELERTLRVQRKWRRRSQKTGNFVLVVSGGGGVMKPSRGQKRIFRSSRLEGLESPNDTRVKNPFEWAGHRLPASPTPADPFPYSTRSPWPPRGIRRFRLRRDGPFLGLPSPASKK